MLGGVFCRPRQDPATFIQGRESNDLLNLSQPDKIREIHLAYFHAGADIVSTNTFSSTLHRAGRIRHGRHCARTEPAGRAVCARRGRSGAGRGCRPRFVGGSICRTNPPASISPDVMRFARRDQQADRAAFGVDRAWISVAKRPGLRPTQGSALFFRPRGMLIERARSTCRSAARCHGTPDHGVHQTVPDTRLARLAQQFRDYCPARI